VRFGDLDVPKRITRSKTRFIQFAPQILQPDGSAEGQHLVDASGDPPTDAGQPLQPVHALAIEQCLHILIQGIHCSRGAPVGLNPKTVRSLLLQQIGDLPQLAGNGMIELKFHKRAYLYNDDRSSSHLCPWK